MEIIDKLNTTEELRKLSYKEKEQLSEELREMVLNTVSKTGGHLASNLGVVELTIAIHSIFETPEDKVIWDVGHQTYIHKILTGRKDKIDTLRTMGGLSGFPKSAESEYDCFETGHSSTSISAALGMARARDLIYESKLQEEKNVINEKEKVNKKDEGTQKKVEKNKESSQKIVKKKNSVVAVIGDGALTGGMALEALNDAGASNTDIIVILNDNEMSISKNVGGISSFLTKLRTRKFYKRSNETVKRIVCKFPGRTGENVIHFVKKIKHGLKQIILPNMFFEDIGFKYFGPVDGHNIEELEAILKKAKEQEGPILVHVITKKGKGFIPAETNPDKFHSTSSFNLVTGQSNKPKTTDYSQVFGETLVELAKDNKNIVAITAAMKDGTGLSSFAKEFPNRFFDVGIAEQHSLTMAAGMAKMGLKPVVSIYSSFYQRGYDQVIHDIAIQNLPVVMCVDRAGIVGNDGETHQGTFDLAFFNIVPNLVIMAPKDFNELRQMLKYALELNKPVVIRYPRGSQDITCIFEEKEKLELGKSEIIKELEINGVEESKFLTVKNRKGFDKQKSVNKNNFAEGELESKNSNWLEEKSNKVMVSIIAIGKMVAKAKKVSDWLEEKGINTEIINVRFLKPLDEETIRKSIEKTKKVITIEDGILKGGLATEVTSIITKNSISNVKIKSYGYPDEFIKHGTVEQIEELYGLNVENIVEQFISEIKQEEENGYERKKFCLK